MRVLLLISVVAILAISAVAGGILLVLHSDASDRHEHNASELRKQVNAVAEGKSDSIYLYDTVGTDDLLETLNPAMNIREVELELTDVTDDGIRIISRLPNLERLTVYGGYHSISDVGLQYVGGCRSLQQLNLVNTKVTDDGLRHLAAMTSLEALTLEWSSVNDGGFTDAAFDQIESIPRLRQVRLVGSWASDEAVDRFRKRKPATEVVRLASYRSKPVTEQVRL